MNAGTDVVKIKKEWGREFSDLECADDWEQLANEHQQPSRWCTHWRKILRHDSGKTIAIEYAQDIGDGESASAYEDEWYEVEAHEVKVTKWRRRPVDDPPPIC